MIAPFLKPIVAKRLLVINMLLAVLYFVGLFVFFQRGNIYLYLGLILGEVFHLWQLLTLIHVAWEPRIKHYFDRTFQPAVDVYITVAGEPIDVVAKTVAAAARMDYPNFRVYILNDGFVANKDNWEAIESIARRYDHRVQCITRKKPGGAKAGNINHALKLTKAPFVAILDCDHVPRRYFLKRLVGFFGDERVAFVQAPQYYANHGESYVANAAWQQQTLFFGPICRGKDHTNALFMCGTNMILRRKALNEVGGMNAGSITEDLLTSLLLHSRGWRSVYVPLIVAHGMAPEDLGEFWKQQYRWARGSLEVLWRFNPIFIKGLTQNQRIQYLASVTYYLTGLVVLIEGALPLFYFYFNQIPITSATMTIGLVFVPYIFLTLYCLQIFSNFAFSFRAIAFSIASWPIFVSAFLATMFRRDGGFQVTSKERIDANYLHLVSLHVLYMFAVAIGVVYAAIHTGINSSLITNASWAILYIVMFVPFIRAAMSERLAEKLPGTDVELPAEEVVNETGR
ncbi:MAG TPA: glycosyltransferase [Candidatus Saccharimonadales bacterium]|nr:glycosyltransferase [Candidatus Saccharimonadales bacterium]